MPKKHFSELRRDAHHGGWVLLPFQTEREELLNSPRSEWGEEPFDSESGLDRSGAHQIWSKTAKLPNGERQTVQVFANAYALYHVEGDEDRVGVGMYDKMRGLGAHEIIIESPNRNDCLLTMTPYQYAVTIDAVQSRIHDLKNDFRLRSFSWFREWDCRETPNGPCPHSQLIANAIIPLGLKNELDSAREYYRYKERCLFCDMIRQEITDEERVITETNEFISYSPFASRHPFEVHLFPKKHSHDFSNMDTQLYIQLASMIRDTATRLQKAIPGWRVMMALHTSPVFDPNRTYHHSIGRDFHWHIEFLPQPPGGLDWYSRTGTHVECTPPENAAAFLREIEVASPWG